MEIPRIPILGVQVSVVNMGIAQKQFQTWITEHGNHYVCVVPAHSIMECVNNPGLLPVFNGADMVTPDGMAVVWLAKLKGHPEVSRVYGPDLLMESCKRGLELGWRHYFLGGTTEAKEELKKVLQSHFPGIQITGQLSPPFRALTPEEEKNIVNEINAGSPDILWVGFGSPTQELWMHNHLGKINVPVMVGVGAAFDFLSGRKRQAPHWIQRIGMEWLFRLLSEPARLWPRYRQYPRFMFLVIKELLRERMTSREN